MRLHDQRARPRGHARSRDELERHGSALPVTVENDVNLAALGEQWLGVARGVDDFVFLSIGTGIGAGLVLARRAPPRPRTAPPARSTSRSPGSDGEHRPVAPSAVSALAARLAAAGTIRTAARRRRTTPRDVFAAARGGDAVRARRRRREAARRIALHVVPIAAVADVALVVLGGGIGSNGDLLLEPVRELLDDVDAVPAAGRGLEPRRGRGATGALAVGLRSALDNVFVNRPNAAQL